MVLTLLKVSLTPLCTPLAAIQIRAEMLLRNPLLQLIFFLAIWIFAIVDAVQAKITSYGPLNPSAVPRQSIDIAVGSSVTTNPSSSWISNSGRFAFGFYHDNDGFSVGIQLIASPSETLVVWTAKPDLKPFSKDAFLNFTAKGLFLTPAKGAQPFPLFNISSTANSATMLDNGNFVVSQLSNSKSSDISQLSLAATGATANDKFIKDPDSKPNGARFAQANNPYSRSCSRVLYCRSSSSYRSSTSYSIIWRSFDFPTDTILGDQILPCGYNLTSSAGELVLNLPCGGANLISYRLNSADEIWDTGASGGDYSSLNLNGDGRLYLTSSGGNEKDLYGYKPQTAHMIYRATLHPDSIFRLHALNLDTNSTIVLNEIPYYKDKCQTKDACGVNSYCFLANTFAQCNCMPGFVYIRPDAQFAGCRRNKTLPSCAADASSIFSMEAVENIVGMDELAYSVVSTASKEDCSDACLIDCNCGAASFIDQRCLKLKLPVTGGRKDINYPSVAFIKSAGAAPPTKSGERGKREIRWKAIFISAASTISICVVLLAAAFAAYWFLFGRFREEWRRWEMALSEEIAPRYFSYQEILKGSVEFRHPLGKGGHGTVFKAALPMGDDKIVAVAVKKLHGAAIEGEKEFRSEMRLIGRAYHANLVRLLGFCHDGPSRLIVYELMSRGSLANHIFESRDRRPSWDRRAAMLLDAARGIHYLHHDCETKIIHRDIKPENILIAEDWKAKIADFGIAKLLNKGETRAATRTMAAGTEGYVAPECERPADGAEETLVTEKADVYSYGIVVLETICGKRNREVSNPSLREVVRKSYEAKELWKMVDGEEVEAVELEKVVKMGLMCVEEDPNARPDMEDVVMMMEGFIDAPTPLPPVPSPPPPPPPPPLEIA